MKVRDSFGICCAIALTCLANIGTARADNLSEASITDISGGTVSATGHWAITFTYNAKNDGLAERDFEAFGETYVDGAMYVEGEETKSFSMPGKNHWIGKFFKYDADLLFPLHDHIHHGTIHHIEPNNNRDLKDEESFAQLAPDW